MNKQTPFYVQLSDEIKKLGGIHNAHLHLDRAGIIGDHYFPKGEHQIIARSDISLHHKHYLINAIHQGLAYTEADLKRRVNDCLDVMVACNTRQADTLVDVTADCVGLTALHTLQDIQEARRHEIDLRLGAYSPLGFSDNEPERWEIFEQGAEQADFIAALPEADDVDDYPDNIGYEEHCLRTLHLAKRLGKVLHVHTDQRNEPNEAGTERLLDVVEQHGTLVLGSDEPAIWTVHMISPSTYDEARFEKLTQRLLDNNVGVICCPSAAIGMRQLRPLMTPNYNSIPRVLELLAAGVHVKLASDNIADMCSPSTTADLVDEVFILSAAIRFYHIGILAKLAVGLKLDEADRQLIADHLEKNKQEIHKVLVSTGHKVDAQ